MRKLAIFDFCETVVSIQTANAFLDFFFSIEPTLPYKVIKFLNPVLSRLERYGIISADLDKKIRVWPLRGVSISELKKHQVEFLDFLKRHENKIIIEKIKEHQNQGNLVIIISGGFSFYLREYAKEKNISRVIATDLEIKNGFFTGRLQGLNCMGKNKVQKLKQSLDLDNFDLINSYVYSDSLSDQPLFDLVGNKILVSKNGELKKI